MSKIELPEVGPGNSGRLRTNDNFRKVEETLNDKVLFRDNPTGEPNEMNNDLDMNSNRVYNLPVPTLDHEATPWGEVKGGVPAAKEWAEKAKESALEAAESADESAASALVATEQAERAETEADRAQDAADSVSGAIGRIEDLEEDVAELESGKMDKNSLVLYVDDFGAVGDGITNDQPAIVSALAEAAGRPVLLTSGKTYLVGSQVTYLGDVDLRTTGADKATIFHNGQSFTPVSIQGSPTGIVRNLTSDMQNGNIGWVLDSSAGIQVGMLAEVKSSASWYHDPRPESSDCRKSELHKVAKITGSTVFMEDVANDTYNLATESVQITFYTPVKVRIDNLKVRCVLAPIGPNAAWVNGLEVRYGVDTLITNTDISEAAGRGVFLNACYRARVIGGTIEKANNQGLGYGVQTYGASHITLDGIKFHENRKCVDWSAGNIVSRYQTVENCSAFGGGVNSEGNPYNWSDAGLNGIPQVGFGGHGGADHCFFRNNTIVNMRYGINSLSRNVVIENNYFVGRASYGIIIDQGENAWVRNNIVYDGWSELKNDEVLVGFANLAQRRMISFLRMGPNWMGGRLYVTDNEMQISTSMISFDGTTNGCRLTAKDNIAEFAAVADGTQTYLIDLNAGVETVTDWDIADNIYTLKGTNAPLPLMFRGVTLGARTVLADGHAYSGRYTATVTPAVNVATVTNSTQPYQFVRIGDTVQVNGSFTFTPTTAASVSSLLVSLPLPPNNVFTSGDQAIGVVGSNLAGFGYCNAAPPIQVRVFFTATAAAATKVNFSFTYRM